MGADSREARVVGWCGRAMKTLSPLIERIEADIMGSDLLHADDTPIRVLDRSLRDKGLGKGVRQGRIWAYVRDQRPWAGPHHPVLSIGSHRTGRRSTFSGIWPTPAASCKRTATRAMPSFTSLVPMACCVCERRPVGRTSGALAIVLGPMAEKWLATRLLGIDQVGDRPRGARPDRQALRHRARQRAIMRHWFKHNGERPPR